MLPWLRLCQAFALALTLDIVCSSPVDDLPSRKGRPWTVGQAVNTTSGTIVGHAATNTTQVSEYLGIRYAEPPVGDLRFAAPKAYKSNATYNAVNFSPDCPANTFSSTDAGSFIGDLAGTPAILLLAELGQVGNVQSEDCLSINVWAKPQVGEKKKAVLLWIYGGGFSTGSSNNPGYVGKYIADKQDVIVVSINYRVNVFGFPGLPVKSVAQNAGLQDQRLAVEWVRDNIAKFGGDPKRITLFGQSAGGGSVDYYTYAWTKDPIVNAFIPQSGTATSFSNPPPLNNTEAFVNGSIALGCGNGSAGLDAALACVRTKSFTDVLAATKVTDPLRAVLGNFGPTIDGKVVFKDYTKRAERGNFIQRPYLTGNNNYEAGLFKLLGSVGSNITDQEWCIFDAAVFTCPAAKAATYRTRQQVNTFRYRYYGEYPNLRLTLTGRFGPSGAWHGSEIPMIFGTQFDATTEANTAPETGLSNYMQRVWAAFAKDPEHALYEDPFGFPQYNSLKPSLIRFGLNNATEPSFVWPSATDSLCAILEELGKDLPGGIGGLLTSGGALPPGFADALPKNVTLCSPLS